jgi:hypothetical protein
MAPLGQASRGEAARGRAGRSSVATKSANAYRRAILWMAECGFPVALSGVGSEGGTGLAQATRSLGSGSK